MKVCFSIFTANFWMTTQEHGKNCLMQSLPPTLIQQMSARKCPDQGVRDDIWIQSAQPLYIASKMFCKRVGNSGYQVYTVEWAGPD